METKTTMSKKTFTEKEIKLLSANEYVKSVSSKGITYTNEIKHVFIAEKEKGKFATGLFEECGLDVDVLGWYRELNQLVKDGKQHYKRNGLWDRWYKGRKFRDTKKTRAHTRRKKYSPWSPSELTKGRKWTFKKDSIRRKGDKEVVLPLVKSSFFIHLVIRKYQLKEMVSYSVNQPVCQEAAIIGTFQWNHKNIENKRK